MIYKYRILYMYINSTKPNLTGRPRNKEIGQQEHLWLLWNSVNFKTKLLTTCLSFYILYN